MSSTLSTQQMVVELQKRCPFGPDSPTCLGKLNNAFRWIDQNGPTVWRLTYSVLVVGAGATNVNLPADFDPSKPMYMSGGPSWRLQIPFKPWDKFLQLQTTGGSPMGAAVGMFSAWSWAANMTGSPAVYSYTAYFFPTTGAPAAPTNFPFIYHRLTPPPLTSGPTTYYPTPDAYDDVIVDLAEAELKRQYQIVGWEMAQKRGETALMRLAAGTRSSKEVVAELMEQSKQTQEIGMARQE